MTAALRRFGSRPIGVLSVLAVVQMTATVVFGVTVIQHNGWAYYHGGDQLWFSSYAALLGDFRLPPADVGFGWAFFLVPLIWLTGPSYVEALPPVAALNILVLGPIALVCVYAIGARIAGRLFGYFAAFLWITAPYLSIWVFVDRYQERYIDNFLPQALGLTMLADFPSMVALLAAAVFVLRAIDRRSSGDALVAGLIVGYAIGMKPSNGVFVTGVLLGYAVARRIRLAVVTLAAIMPGLTTLVIWKQRGLGQLPLFAEPASVQAVGAWVSAVPGEDWFSRFVPLDWGHLWRQIELLHEFSDVAPLLEALPLLGLLVLLVRREHAVTALLAGWLGAFTLFKATATVASIEAGSFFRLLMPAWPAYFLPVVAVGLTPALLARRRARPACPWGKPGLPSSVGAVAGIMTLAALAIVSFARPVGGPEQAILQKDGRITSVDPRIALRATRANGVNSLSWEAPDYPARVYYVIYRGTPGQPTTACERRGVVRCTLRMFPLGHTRTTTFTDRRSFPGMTYRVGVGTSYDDDPLHGDVFLFSRPVVATG